MSFVDTTGRMKFEDFTDAQAAGLRAPPSNDEIDPNAGKVELDPAMPWGRGIIHDIRTTVGTHWLAEVTNFNQKTIAVSTLIFISIIPPTLAFGASYGRMTGSRIGAIETILATSWIGVAYSLIGGMPMCIVGSTGPALAISTAVKNMSDSFGVNYLPFNGWVSIWLFVYCVTCCFFDGTRYVRLATRFTDEIFASLIVIIFVMDSIGDPFSGSGILRYLQPDHRSHSKQLDEDYDYMTTALLSIIIGFGTTATIFYFRSFKFSSYFCNDTVRSSIHDFGVTMSVAMWTVIKNAGFPDVATEQLNVPSQFEPTFQCCTESCDTFWPTDCPDQEKSFGTRSWFVNLGDLPSWAPFAAAGPAIMAFLLCYLDNGITWHLIMHKHNKLQHGEAYNYDLCLNGLFNMVNGLLGLPWLVATTVPCMLHLNSLAEKDTHGNILSVQETRWTMFLSHLLLGCTMAFLNVLKLLPMPVLYGVFLFMGLSSLPGIQFWNRFLLWFQQPSKYPNMYFLKYMENNRVHMYTCFQIIFFIGIFTVMHIPTISIAFPFMTFLCIPARLLFLPKFFAGWELVLLDGEEDQIENWLHAKAESMRGFKVEDPTTPMEKDMGDSVEASDDAPIPSRPVMAEDDASVANISV